MSDRPDVRAIVRRWTIASFVAVSVPVTLDAYTDTPAIGGRIFVATMLVFHVLVVSAAPRVGAMRVAFEAVGFAVAALPAIEVVRGMVGADPARLAIVAATVAGAHVVGRAIGAAPPAARRALHVVVAALAAWPLVGYVGREAFDRDWGRGPIAPVVAAFEAAAVRPTPPSPAADPADPSASTRVRRGGFVRPGSPVVVAGDRPWRATWPGGDVRAAREAAFPWPARGRVAFTGPGAPAASAVRPVARDVALFGVPPGVAVDAEARTRVEARVPRTVRWVALDEADVASPAVLAGLDAIAVDRASSLERFDGVADWVGLGGRAFALDPTSGGVRPYGFGRIDRDGPAAGARAAIRPSAPPAPTRGDGPPRAWLLVVAALVAFAIATAPVGGSCGAVAVAAALAFGVVGDGWWTVRAMRVHWCQPPGSTRAIGHRIDAVRPRGARPARVSVASSSAITRLPPQPSVDATGPRVEVTWRGAGRVGSLLTETLGGAIEVTAGSEPLLRVGWRDGVVLDPAFHVSPRGIVRLAPLHGGFAGPIAGDRVPTDAIPEPIAELIRRSPPPPAAGAIVGVLRGLGADGPYTAPLVAR